MTVLGRSLIFQPMLLVCTYSDTIITLQKKKIDTTDFPSKFAHIKVDSTSKDNWHGIKTEHAKRNKMRKDRLKCKA